MVSVKDLSARLQNLRNLREKLCKKEKTWQEAFNARDWIVDQIGLLRQMCDDDELKTMLESRSDTAKELNDEVMTNFINAYKNRASTINDLVFSCNSLFSDEIKYDQASVDKFFKNEILPALKDVVDALRGSNWNQESISEALKSVCDRHEIGFGKIGQPIRIAVTGGTQSPSIDQTLILLDQSIVVDRIEAAIEYIEKKSN